jgi:hypothetical protein
MSVLEFYNLTRERFVYITQIADKEHIKIWDDIDPDLAYSWFESLAKALNKEISSGVDAVKYKELLNFINSNYLEGNEQIKNCIDVAFTENLFWQIQPCKVLPYWNILPPVMQELYIKFHGCKPL